MGRVHIVAAEESVVEVMVVGAAVAAAVGLLALQQALVERGGVYPYVASPGEGELEVLWY